MYEQIEKPKENKSRAVANSVAHKKRNGKKGIGFVDNRPKVVAQRKLQALANNNYKENKITQRMHSPIQRLISGAAIEGAFTTIPSGTLAPDWNSGDNVLVKGFDMNATFNVPRTASGGIGEFRQYIKGYFESNGVRDTHTLIGTETLDESTWKEDGDATGGYGYHNSQTVGNKYTETSTGKEMYKGRDTPESNPAPTTGDTTTMNLNFKGQLVDADSSGNVNSIIVEKTWDVVGSHTHA
jgi:hypothetical protein